ncbi:MAG: efflux RND transporter permease subunit [Betaproteobacteria bacterium]|nr:efflux RND transporter permease subunit [Betaproteobacteria bacterium]
MNISAPFIDRPIATTLITIGLTLVGMVAFLLLPVSPLPRVDIPTIAVSAALPGASPETMAATVAMPIERELGRIAGITEMTSSSALGATRIVLQFDLDRDINGAARDVQAALNATRSVLPSGMLGNPTYRKVNPADAPIMILGLTSETMTQGQMYDAASTIIAQKISQVDGVGQVQVGGSSLPAVRVEINPQALDKYGIGFEEVRAVLAGANANRPKGAVEDAGRHWQIGANDQAKTAAEYLPLIVTYRNGAPVRLTEVANVIDSVQDLRNAGSANGKPSVLVIISRQPNANIIETVDRVTELLPALRASIPGAIDLSVTMERTTTIRASLRDAGKTLALSVGLVMLVVLLFLRNGRAALIPTVAVPVSLTVTFAVMYLCGYSLDNLSLMALTIATGFVVDDAIVVVENVSRHIENGVPPLEAARIGAAEVGFTVLAMTLSLVAVFIPMLLMGGFVGRFFQEFAVTLSAAILVSLAVSLTTTPMMCARLLLPVKERRNGRLHVWSERGFGTVLQAYRKSLAWCLDHGPLTALILLGTVCLNVYLYVIISKGFFPQQDTGQLTGRIQADQSVSFQLMRQKLANFIDIVRADPGVESVVGFTGGAQRNTGSIFVTLKPLAVRGESADKIVARLRVQLAKEPGANLFLNPVQDIRVGGRQSRASHQYTIQADDLAELRIWEPRILQALAQLPELVDVNSDQQTKGLQTSLVVDRDAAARLGVTSKMIDATLNDAYAQRQVSTIYAPLNQYHVVMEAAPEFWQSPQALNYLHVSVPGGAQVPFSMFARHAPSETSLSVNHQSQFVATTISFNLPGGVPLSQATRAIEDTVSRIGMPNSVRGSFQGSARAFRAVLETQPILILAALLTLYIVLGVLYESFIHPLTILSTLPSAGLGALVALMLFRTEFSVIALIGVIMLIGIVQKNAIMMIDFAIATERAGKLSSRDAIFEACLLRFRPILMTTVAALLAALPLALGKGGGAELRQPLGIAIGGGLILSQILTLYTTPIVYLYLDRFSLWLRDLRRRHNLGAGFAPAADSR